MIVNAKTQRYVDGLALPTYTLNIGNTWYNINDIKLLIKTNIKQTSPKNKKLKKALKKETILGYSCSVYKEKRETPFGIDMTTYAVADSLKADLSNGSSMVINGKNVLKVTQKKDGEIYEIEAIEITKTPLPDSLFILPDYPIIEVDFEKISKQYIKEEAGY